eukprot:349945-Chlamydomonas_euryale.AAC.6
MRASCAVRHSSPSPPPPVRTHARCTRGAALDPTPPPPLRRLYVRVAWTSARSQHAGRRRRLRGLGWDA